ncbi:MAG TPA: universal stress protein [Candidatus Sulfomarinibacteraceae bacterium]|nr:universal stress protein [Candidatus Sulfomarinibacteraceae bacterium]
MRVLFATDGSRSADRARDLLNRLPWPIGTSFCVTSALEPRGELFAAPWMMPAPKELDSVEAELLRHADVTLDDAVRTLEGPGRTVERITLRGHPASAIVEEATAWKADLVVVGNRGHGPIASMVLGSVSAEVVDHAPCPVLVVRDGAVSSVVLAVDGSPGAERAVQVIRSWPILHDLPVAVVGVAETAVPWGAGMVVGLYDEVITSYAQDVDLARRGTSDLVNQVAESLVAAGVHASPHVLEGDPGHEIVEFARRRPGSLVVVGTRGLGGLSRLVLGSVARNVLLHAAGSVLVVRETVGGTEVEGGAEQERVGSAAD